MKKSNFLNWNVADFAKGFIVAFIAALLTNVSELVQSGRLPNKEELVFSLVVALNGGIAYLIKNFLSNSEGKILKKEDNQQL